MALDKAVDSAALNNGLTSVANAIRNKGGTTADLAFPDGFVSAINAVSTGVTVQTNTGSFTTNSSGSATVNVGFQPDFVAFSAGNTPEGRASYPGFPFKESGKTTVEVAHSPASSSNLLGMTVCTRTSNGFTVSMKKMTTSLSMSAESNRRCSWVAVKYS